MGVLFCVGELSQEGRVSVPPGGWGGGGSSVG
jgi:hypothetical protein